MVFILQTAGHVGNSRAEGRQSRRQELPGKNTTSLRMEGRALLNLSPVCCFTDGTLSSPHYNPRE